MKHRRMTCLLLWFLLSIPVGLILSHLIQRGLQ